LVNGPVTVRPSAVPYCRRSVVVRLLIAIAVGVVLAVGAAALASSALTGVANGTPSKASLYQYGTR
jgi:hypothetical protein